MSAASGPGIKVSDIAFVRFSAPDLDRMQAFLEDFGLVVHERSDGRLYARGSDPVPWIHATEIGPGGFRGVAFAASSERDLETVARMEGASDIEPLDGPGGGHRVRMTDPDGYSVEVVHGRAALDALPVRGALPHNRGSERRRLGRLQRVPAGPAQVKRLGHAVVRVRDLATSEAWYKSRFGFLVSDEVRIDENGPAVTSFLRCDRGPVHVDHHTFLCVGVGEPGFDHAAFEVEDFDAVMCGHEYLTSHDWDHAAGVGRHILGSQVFDYWRDPWGNMLEHFTDGDLLDASAPAGRQTPRVALGTQWGRFG